MTTHLTDQDIQALLRGGLTATDLIAADDHLASCPDCRARAQGLLPQNALGAVQEAFLTGPNLETTHPEFETLSAYLDGKMDAETRADVQGHVDGCRQCLGELQAMHRMRLEIRDAPAKTYAPARPPGVFGGWPELFRAPQWRPALATGAAVLVAAALFFGLHTGPPSTSRHIVAVVPPNSHPLLPEKQVETIGPNEVGVLGAHNAAHPSAQLDRPTLTSPTRGQVTSARPTFVWSTPSGANGSQVFLYHDGSSRLAAASGRLAQRQWTVTRPLTSGASYRWAVQAYRGNEKFGLLSSSAVFRVSK